jgi:hypothetical protein
MPARRYKSGKGVAQLCDKNNIWEIFLIKELNSLGILHEKIRRFKLHRTPITATEISFTEGPIKTIINIGQITRKYKLMDI